MNLVGSKAKRLVGNKWERRLRVATWNFSGLCSDRKQKEVGELLAKHNLDVVAGQESWEKEESRIEVEGYKWFGKPRSKQNSPRGEGEVGFLVRECLANMVEFINSVKYEESVWMKVRSERGREALYIGYVYMPTDSASISVVDSCYERLKEDVLSFREKGKFVLLGDFNARVGRSVQIDDVIGMFGEDMCNASGNRLLSFLNEVELMICNGRKLVSEPEWTRVRPSLKQKSIIDYIITDAQLLEVSGNVHVDRTDIGSSDHFLVWMELGRATKTSKKRKRVIRRWRLDRFGDDEADKQRRHSQKSRINTQERKQLIKSPSEAEREENFIMPSTLHFDNSNNPLEVIRGHFTTFKKCCQRHDIQNIVVVGTTYPASEALGPKRKHSSINDLRKEDRHTHFSFSSLSTKGRNNALKKVTETTPTTETEVPSEAKIYAHERCHHCTPPVKNAGDTETSWNLENKTGNQPSIQSLTSNNEFCYQHSSNSLCLPNNWIKLLSISQRQFHEERITTIAELIHAQDYRRILPLSYWGNPPPNLPPEYLIAYIFSTALSYYKMGSNKESLVQFQMSLNQAEVFGSKGDVTISCVYIGDIEFSQRKFIEAAKQYQTALKNYSRESVARFFCMVLPSQSALCAKHGSALKNATKVVDAISAYELAIAKAESKKDKLSAHTSLGNLLQSLGENSRAITEYETSIELATALHDSVSLGWVYENMGNAFLGLYQREITLHHLEKSLNITVEHEPIPQAIGRAYNNLETTHQALNELDKAEEFYDLALGQAISDDDIAGQARVCGIIGNLLMLKKECDRAVPHYTEVLRLSQDRSIVSTVHHNRGCAYYEWAETKKETFLNKDRDIMPMAASLDTNIKPLLHGPQFEQCEREYRPPFIPENIKKYYTQATKDLDYVIRHHEESLDSIKGSAKGLSFSVSLFESNSRTFHRKQDCLVSTGNFEEACTASSRAEQGKDSWGTATEEKRPSTGAPAQISSFS